MKFSSLFGWAFGVSCLLAVPFAGANPCNSPKRMIGGHTVSLQPLLDWWANPRGGVRPLSGWKHLRGTIVREMAYGWIIEGKAEGEHSSQFLVKNPPVERLRKFQDLQRQLPAYERDRAELNEYLTRPVRTDWYDYWGSYDSSVTPISWTEQQDAIARVEQIDQIIAWIHQELGYLEDEQGNFRFDAFALRLSDKYEGLPVYDHGYPIAIR